MLCTKSLSARTRPAFLSEEFLAQLPAPLAELMGTIHPRPEGLWGLRWRGYELSSVFQPIVSFSCNCVIGHEALMRGVSATGERPAPPELLAQAQQLGELGWMDRACRALHILNFGETPGKLFLNYPPQLFGEPESEAICGTLLCSMAEHWNIDPRRIVIEIIEDAVDESSRFVVGAQHLREMGMTLALDDFGARESSFERIWNLQPGIVKLDRAFAVRSVEDVRIRRSLRHIVEIMHGSGAQVVLEGIETEEQALIAMDANVDFGQGWYFARPAEQTLEEGSPAIQSSLRAVWNAFQVQARRQELQHQSVVAPILDLVSQVALRFQQQTEFASVADAILQVQASRSVYLLDASGCLVDGPLMASCRDDQGRPCTHCADGCEKTGQPRLALDVEANRRMSQAHLAHRPFFRQAMRTPSAVQMTNPYLSLQDGLPTVTISKCIGLEGKPFVLCCDLDWHTLAMMLRPGSRSLVCGPEFTLL